MPKKQPAAPASRTRPPAPGRRPLRVFAFDPSRGRRLGNEMQIEVRYRPLAPGPVDLSGARDQVAVVDYDASRKVYYRPVDLDDPYVLIANGLAPSEGDPCFHQQMVYAVASETIENFERALGRRIHWRRAERGLDAEPGWQPDDILTLNLYPHGMRQANAYYSPELHGILFGYFQAGQKADGLGMPGQMVYTCLSHDIIAHEMTHAILDGMRSHFMEQTNPDVAAFHEAFADLVALFQHFTHREVLLDAIQRTGGRLYTPAMKGDPLTDLAGQSWLGAGEDEPNPLLALAAQFGEAMGSRAGLRSAIGKPKTMLELQQPMDCHERGAILVAAVFDAFFTVYLRRAARHFRIYRSAGGISRDDLGQPLAEALCEEAMRTADQFCRSCMRAIDYLPPVDITFGDFLRAVMTSEANYDPGDGEGVRDAWLQAFRRRQILPLDAPFFSADGLCWPEAERLKVEGLPFGGPLGLAFAEQKQTAQVLERFIEEHRAVLGLEPALPFRIPSFHPLYRTDHRGSVRWDLVVEVVQSVESEDGYPVRGGATLIISTHGTGSGGERGETFLRYAIHKPLPADRRHPMPAGHDHGRGHDHHHADAPQSLRINFALLHGGD